jgi:hypothetical protein
MNDIFNRHIELLERVNRSATNKEYDKAYAYLCAFREALALTGINQLMDCDNYYLEQGVDRPMCCGVFLDWSECTDSNNTEDN